jgi:dTMP kinase
LTDQGEEGRLGDTVLPYLFAADRRDHLDREIIPMLQKGGLVISDRYLHSSLAYQSLAIGLPAVANLTAEFRQPDLILYLDLDPETCLQRIIARGDRLERFEAIDRLRRIRDAYSTVIVLGRTQGQNIVSIDASQSIEGVHADVLAAVGALEQSQNQPPPTA